MNMGDRAKSYLAASKIHRPLDLVPTADGGRLEGLWVLGNNYRGSGYHGAFPPGFMKRIRALFPDCPTLIHLFSGSLSKEPGTIRIDSNPKTNPDVVGDAEDLGPLAHLFSGIRLAVGDCPYTKEDADHYGTVMINRKKVLAEVWGVMPRGGFLVWLDQVWPMYRKTDWILRGLIGVARSTQHRARLVTILEKK